MRFLALFGLAAAYSGLDADWFYSQCNSIVIANAALTSQCSTSSSSSSSSKGQHKRGHGSKTNSISATCYCPLIEYQESVYECIAYAKKVSNSPERSIKESWKYVEANCLKSNVTIKSFDEIKSYIAENPVTQTFAEASKSGSGAFLADTAKVNASSSATYVESHYQGYYEELFPMITLWYVAAICFLQIIFHWSSYLIPGGVRLFLNNPIGRKVRRHVTLPALFNRHRSAPLKVLRYFMLCFPSRFETLQIFGFVFLCVFFLAFHFPYADGQQILMKYLARRSGQLAMYKLPMVYLFAGRNNFLIWLTGWQFEVFNHWHRWTARMLTVDVIVHGVAYTIDFLDLGRGWSFWTNTYMIWGGIAIVSMCFLCLNGTKTLRQLAYETFLYIHIILAALALAGTHYHVKTRSGYKLQYGAWAVWAFDRLVRFIKIFISNPMSKAHIKAHPGGTLEITIKYSGLWKPSAGTYIFIHFMHPLYFIQSHPFTIVPMNDKGEMKIYVKALKGITKTLYKCAQKNGGECDYRVLVEGPYGVGFSTKSYKEVVLIAGGIGITAIYSHLEHIVKSAEEQIIHVHWAMSSPEPLSWFKEEIDRMTAYTNVHVIVHMADAHTHLERQSSHGSNTAGSENDKYDTEKKEVSSATISIDGLSFRSVSFRPSYKQIISDHIEHSQGDIVFFVCGPDTMTDAVRSGVTNNMFKTRNLVQYFEESFSM